jgi:Asp-tRNA(Asn)/Glu-tRNA(Gln) amidotransferase C subunit
MSLRACSGGPGAGILGRMGTIDVETLRQAALLAGFDFAAAEIEPLLPAIERALQALGRLEALPLASVEPVTQYRVV